MAGWKVLILTAVLLAAGNANAQTLPPAAPIAADPYLNLPLNSPDFLVRAVLEGAVTAAYFRSDFAQLEAMAKYYRDTGAKTPSGAWKLALLYDALSLEGDSAHPDEYPLKRAEEKDLKWIAAFPQSPMPYIVYARQLVDHGEFFRGTGNADTVTVAKVERYHGYLEQARDILKKHKAISATDPEWYVVMMWVARGEGWQKEQFEPLLSEGLDRFPYYTHLYSQGATLYLPVWGGNIDDLDSFAEDAVSRTADKEGTILYARIYASVSFALDNMFETSRVQWPKMANALVELMHRYPDVRNENVYAYFACAAGDKIGMIHIMPLLTGPPDFVVWKTQDNIDRCRAWASDGKPPDGKSPLPEYGGPIERPPESSNDVLAPTL